MAALSKAFQEAERKVPSDGDEAAPAEDASANGTKDESTGTEEASKGDS